jgi:hypothetical protein
MELLFFHLINIQASEYIWVKDRLLKKFKNGSVLKYKIFFDFIFDPKKF